MRSSIHGRAGIVLAVIALSGGIVACGGDDEEGGAAGEQPATKPGAPVAGKPGGKLTVLWTDDLTFSDPGQSYYQMDFMVHYATQRPLYSYKPENGTQMVPDLAESAPEVSADGKTVTVKIRKGVKFSAPVNREVTSKDVKYAIERGFFNTVNNGYAGAYFGALEGAKVAAKPGSKIPGIETPDDQTIVFKLSEPQGGVLASGALGMTLTAPVAEEYAQKFDAKNPSSYGQHQTATGPYMIEQDAKGNAVGYEAGKRLHLVRNGGFWRSSQQQL